MSVVIFGAQGQLGHACSIAFSNVHGYAHTEVDVRDETAVHSILASIRPSVVINATAFCSVEDAEKTPDVSFSAYGVVPLLLARATSALGATLIHISSDYVFDGTKDSFSEQDPVNPRNVYGVSKVAGEHAVRTFNPHHYIIRTSALFGCRGKGSDKNFVSKRIEELKRGTTVRMVNDQWTVPTYTEDVAHALVSMVEKELPCGTYHVVNGGGGVTWYDFARTIAKEAGFSENQIVPISSAELLSHVKRPVRSVLSSDLLSTFGITLPSWEDGLRRYLTKLT